MPFTVQQSKYLSNFSYCPFFTQLQCKAKKRIRGFCPSDGSIIFHSVPRLKPPYPSLLCTYIIQCMLCILYICILYNIFIQYWKLLRGSSYTESWNIQSPTQGIQLIPTSWCPTIPALCTVYTPKSWQKQTIFNISAKQIFTEEKKMKF